MEDDDIRAFFKEDMPQLRFINKEKKDEEKTSKQTQLLQQPFVKRPSGSSVEEVEILEVVEQ